MIIYTLPFIAALTGWLTNYIAIKMLFHPRKKIKILFFSIQGIFPKRKEKLAQKLGKVVSEQLFSVEDVKEKVHNNHTIDEIRDMISDKIDDFIDNKLVQVMPMLSMFMNDQLKSQVKKILMSEFSEAVPDILDKMAEKMDSAVDIEKIVYEKVNNFSSDKLEEMLYSIMKKEFRFVEILGGILGFIIGIIQILLLQLQ